MPTKPAKITRLELIIIVAALAVLLFSNRPPQPGNAEIRTDIETPTGNDHTLDTPLGPEFPSIGDRQKDSQTSYDREPADPTQELIGRPPVKRYAMVDARKWNSQKYPNVMYGEITVRWIWDGARFVPTKVCEVREDNGVVSVWSFDGQHEGVTITPVPPDQIPRN
ncbi:MAG TPA: hypothetical protein PK373_10345 [Sedimentisphaerales bacterium]|nr:hypothetical protein [Phycisphaerae bacterium]HON90425.1 hypothetical protein [Sedimentisphaerales bacterium]HQG49476.1 hypothetical protein [Sedimentisphaerales bacterium]